MGLFSSDTKIDVFSSAVALADPDRNEIRDVIVSAILTDRDIVAGLIGHKLSGSAAQIRPMLHYAENYYTLGLPAGEHHDTTILPDATVIAAINTDLVLLNSCVIEYSFITAMSLDWAVLPYLTNTRGYDSILNTVDLTMLPSGMLPLPTQYDGDTLTHKVTVTGVVLNANGVDADVTYLRQSTYTRVFEGSWVTYDRPPVEYIETITGAANLNIGSTYCIAKYRELDGAAQVIESDSWWFYAIQLGLYPTIDNAYTADPENNFFPVVPIRYNNIDYTDISKAGTDLYKTSVILCKKMGLDFLDLGVKVNANPDVANIDHCYIMYGVDLQTTEEESIEYLVRFFDFLHDEETISQNDFMNFSLSDEPAQNSSYSFNSGGRIYGGLLERIFENGASVVNTNVAASLVEEGLNTSVSYSYITSNLVNGSIGVTGTATKSITNNLLTLKLQLTASIYREVVVAGLRHTNKIYGGYSVITTLSDVAGSADEHNFIIPLHYGRAKQLALGRRNELFTQAVHMVINGVVFTEVAWYKTGIFKAVLTIFAVVIAIWTGQYWIVPTMLVMEVLVAILPPEILAALKVAMIVYSIVTVNFGQLASTMTTAAQMLANVSAVIDLVGMAMNYKLLDIADEFEDLAVAQEARSKELEEIEAQLATGSGLHPALMVDRAKMISLLPNESPSQFYYRTLDNNPGINTLNVVSNYHTALLTLPEADNSYAFA